MRLFIFGWVLWVPMAWLLAAPGCSSTLQAFSECPIGEKPCKIHPNDALPTCVSTTNVLFGCGPGANDSCLPCSIGNSPQSVAKYGCNISTHQCLVVQCLPPHQDCDGTCDSDLTTDPLNCGMCSSQWPAANCIQSFQNAPHVVQVGCASATCEVLRCEPGWFDCDGAPGNGCEAQAGPCGCPSRVPETGCCSRCEGATPQTCPTTTCTGTGTTCVTDGGAEGTCTGTGTTCVTDGGAEGACH